MKTRIQSELDEYNNNDFNIEDIENIVKKYFEKEEKQ